MTRWIDEMSPEERDVLRDAGRIGNSRFDGPNKVKLCGICGAEYPRTYEEHSGSERHYRAVRALVGRE
jgi:hypothetical protein